MQHNISHLVENNLYSATSMNFLGTESVLLRSSPVTIRTEFKSSWLNGELPHVQSVLETSSTINVPLPSFRAHLCVHDSDSREPDERSGR